MQAILDEAFSHMARGSQDDPRTVKAVTDSLLNLRKIASFRFEALCPMVQDLLQAAGWLKECFLPSTSWHSEHFTAAWTAWRVCVNMANEALLDHPLDTAAALRAVSGARNRPRVPGEHTSLLVLPPCQHAIHMHPLLISRNPTPTLQHFAL
jgi:hypothetical protein